MISRPGRIAILSFLAALTASASHAAPVLRPANLTLKIEIGRGVGGPIGTVSVGGTGSVSVDPGAGLAIVPAALSLASTVSLPVTTTTAVVSIVGRAGIGQAAATFSVGRATGVSPGEICPAGVTPRACIAGGGINGGMALFGTISVNFGGGFTVPIDLGAAMVGQGARVTIPPLTGFVFENGVWTTGAAVVQFTTITTGTTLVLGMTFTSMTSGAPATLSRTGTGSGLLPGQQITLVTPTFLLAAGNKLPIFSSLTIQVVPEPGTLALLASGVAGLALLARRRPR